MVVVKGCQVALLECKPFAIPFDVGKAWFGLLVVEKLWATGDDNTGETVAIHLNLIHELVILGGVLRHLVLVEGIEQEYAAVLLLYLVDLDKRVVPSQRDKPDVVWQVFLRVGIDIVDKKMGQGGGFSRAGIAQDA